MGWPGEQLLGKMWVTLAEKGIGGLLKPGQIRREALASIEMERVKLLANAQAQRDAEDIKEGRKSISDFSSSIGFKKAELPVNNALRIEPSLDYELACEVVRDQLVHDSIRKEVNVAKAIIHAEEALRDDSEAAPQESIDADWLYRWRDYTGDVSNDDLQKIWGRLLAGEVKSPGSYSLRCLDFLRNLSQAEAKLIERISSLVLMSAVWRPDDNVYKLPLSFKELLELQELGVISGAEALGLSVTLTDTNSNEEKFFKVLICHDKCLLVTHADKKTELTFQIFSVTRLGHQLMSLGEFSANEEYLEALGKKIVSEGFDVSIADIVEVAETYVRWDNARKLAITQE